LAERDSKTNNSDGNSDGINGSRIVLAKFSPNQTAAINNRPLALLAVDGSMFIERVNSEIVPVVMVTQTCPHCVRCGAIQVGEKDYAVHYQGCRNRFVMVAQR
jgi:hypothetical protein